MSTIDLCLNSICLQRKMQMVFNKPPIRYDPISPYIQFPQYNKFDFDMRRKAEILEYNANKSSSKTNNITKKQKWAQIVNGGIKTKSYPDVILQQQDLCGNFYEIVVKYPDTYTTEIQYIGLSYIGLPLYRKLYTVIPGNTTTCQDDTLYLPTSSSDVPGPMMNLYKDNAVPLYNYASKTNRYAIINEKNTESWFHKTANDILINGSTENTLFLLNIQNEIEEYAYNFNIQTPIGLFFNGVAASGNIINIAGISTVVNSINVKVYYNNELVTLQKTPTIQYTPSTLSFDLSMNSSNSSINLNTFQGIQYVGMLSISNLYLYTQPGYVYDIRLSVEMNNSFPTIFTNYFSSFKSGILCNLSHSNSLVQNNCIIQTTVSATLNSGFSLTGS